MSNLIKLTGTAFGFTGSYSAGTGIAALFDGNLATYIDPPTYPQPSATYEQVCGVDLGAAKTVVQLSFAARPGEESRSKGVLVKCGNNADRSGATLVLTLPQIPSGSLTPFPIAPTTARYWWVEKGTSQWLNLAEMQPFAAQTMALGINLPSDSDWEPAMFADAVKDGRRFGPCDQPWVTTGPQPTLNAVGWPMSDCALIAGGGAKAGDIFTLIVDGQPTVTAVSNNHPIITFVKYDATVNQSTYTITIGTGDTMAPCLNFRGIKAATTVQLWRPGYAPQAGKTTQLFTFEFLAAVKGFTCLRAMDFLQTNANPHRQWSDRASANGPFGRDVWEYIIALANSANIDLHINAPTLANDDYCLQLATLIKTNLNANLNLYWEGGNELWNYNFAQARWNYYRAAAEMLDGPTEIGTVDVHNFPDLSTFNNTDYTWAGHYTIRRAVQISKIFAGVFGSQMLTRIRPIYATQFANPGATRAMLNFVAANYGAPSKFFYGMGGAPYFELGKSAAGVNYNTVDGLTVDQVICGSWNDVQALVAMMAAEHQVAVDFNLHHIAYEGGPGTDGTPSQAAKVAAQSDHRMYHLELILFSELEAQGFELFNYYNLLSGWGQSGQWGLGNNTFDRTGPKWQAVLDFQAGKRERIGATNPYLVAMP